MNASSLSLIARAPDAGKKNDNNNEKKNNVARRFIESIEEEDEVLKKFLDRFIYYHFSFIH